MNNRSLALSTLLLGIALSAPALGFQVRDDATGGDCEKPFRVGWTGLTRLEDGRMIATSRTRSLFVVDAANGQIVRHLGSARRQFASDIDVAPDGTVYLNYFDLDLGGGALAVIDLDAETTTTIGMFGLDGAGGSLANGGLSVHPLTHEIYAVESSSGAFRDGTSLMLIDPHTGAAVLHVALQFGGADPGFGFDGLEITPEGRFLATAGGGANQVYELDPVSGSIAPLAFALPPTHGHVNGIESGHTTDAEQVLFVTSDGELLAAELGTLSATLTGDNAAVYGQWLGASRRCRLVRDISGRVDIRGDGIVLDYAGRRHTGQIGPNGGLRVFGDDVVVRNAILAFGGFGIQLHGAHATISHCTVSGPGRIGIAVLGAGARVRHCHFSGLGIGLQAFETSDLRARHITSVANGSGLFLWDSRDVHVRDLDVSDSLDHGVQVHTGSELWLRHGEIVGSAGAGLQVDGFSTVYLDQVEFDDNALGAALVEPGSVVIGDIDD